MCVCVPVAWKLIEVCVCVFMYSATMCVCTVCAIVPLWVGMCVVCVVRRRCIRPGSIGSIILGGRGAINFGLGDYMFVY